VGDGVIFAQPAFTNLEELIDRVYSYIAYRTGPGADAEDATSETFERAIRYRASYDDSKGTPIAWLIGIARSVVADAAADRYRRQNGNGAGHADGGSEDFMPALLERLDLQAALGRLDSRERDLLALRHGADLSTRQIAALLGATPGSVDTALHRARARLGELLESS
jgi:RNA polymerase sigma-70 factor, ECF subfamily